MFKNRFVLIVAVLSILMVTVAVSRSFSGNTKLDGINEPPRPVIVPMTGADNFSDYYQRHPELRSAAEIAVDTTDYFFRHAELRTSTKPVDLTDYYFRHP